jgi:putative DNA primase/helicase
MSEEFKNRKGVQGRERYNWATAPDAAGDYFDRCPRCESDDMRVTVRKDGKRLAECELCGFLDHFDPNRKQPGEAHKNAEQPDGVLLECASNIKPEPIRPLWPGHLALGKTHILSGDGGAGKTTLATAMISIVTTGGFWPDGTRSMRGDVLIWSGEDDPSDTLVPRLMAHGADLSRVYFVCNVREDGELRPFNPATDVTALAHATQGINELRLILVDPIVSAVTGDSHKNTEVRRGLQPLVDLAANTGAALLGITHFSKGGGGTDPTKRVVGSIAFGAVARVVMVAAKVKNEDGTERRILARSKSNIGPDDGGFEYSVEQAEPLPGIHTTRIAWGAPLKGDARELLAEPEMTGERSTLNDACDFLAERLALGTCPAKVLLEEAAAAGFSRTTLHRASEKLRVRKRKGGLNGGWYWSLRTTESPEDSEETTEETQLVNVGNMKSSESSEPSETFSEEVKA